MLMKHCYFQSLHLVIAHDVKQQVVLTGNSEIDKQVGKPYVYITVI